MMKKSFEDFVKIVVDVKYNNFYDDIFSQFVDKNGTAELLKNNKKKQLKLQAKLKKDDGVADKDKNKNINNIINLI